MLPGAFATFELMVQPAVTGGLAIMTKLRDGACLASLFSVSNSTYYKFLIQASLGEKFLF